jgi:hypothetical protein
MSQATETTISIQDGTLVGPLRRPVNPDAGTGSIHNEEVAQSVGFRGGVIGGNIHTDLFPPLMLDAFGKRWFERGTLSLYFLNPTLEGEPVRAYVKQPPTGATDAQVDVWIEREDGMRVGEGTASVGDPGVPTAVLARPERPPQGELRILAGLKVGDPMGEAEVVYPRSLHDERMKVITEKLDWYDDSPWGGPIISPAALCLVLYDKPTAAIYPRLGEALPLFGSIELRNVNGPALVQKPYKVSGQVVSIGDSPKTEYFWFESALDDGGTRIAEMRMLLRFMKASSTLWA